MSLRLSAAAVCVLIATTATAGLYDNAGDLAEACRVAIDSRIAEDPTTIKAALFVGCMGYVNGFWHGSYRGGAICWPSGLTPTRIATLFVAFMDANPHLRSEGPARPMRSAMSAAFPCAR
jgi:hypothetical protein